MTKPVIICMTPVKNEEWILERFLKCASLWADHIIVADDNSTDHSREIAKSFPKVILVENQSSSFGEATRQQLLINKAREIPGKRLLIALDADEFLPGNFIENLEWNAVLNAKEGTVIRFQLANIAPDFENYHLISTNHFPWAFMDDGSPHVGWSIHSPRIPIPEKGNYLDLNKIKILHYGYVDTQRYESKKRWYMCWETLQKKRSPISINRQYLINLSDYPAYKIPQEWLSSYEKQGIDMTSFSKIIIQKNLSSSTSMNFRMKEHYWWEKEIVTMMALHGSYAFTKIDIWYENWMEIAKEYGYTDLSLFKDRRSICDKLFLNYIRSTQAISKKWWIRLADKILSCLGY